MAVFSTEFVWFYEKALIARARSCHSIENSYDIYG